MRRTPHIAKGRGWRRPLSYTQAGALGLLWGVPASATVFQYTLNGEGVSAGLAAFFVFDMPMWSATGLLLAWAYVWLSSRLPAVPAAGLALLAATTGHELIVLTNTGPVAAILGHAPDASNIFFFALWNVICFGGLLVAVLVIARQQAWRTILVTQGEIARNRDDARLSHADAQNLRGQLPPSMLIAAVSELKRRYAADGMGGERLLDQLIAFLRAAMPSIRTGSSTLAAELETVRAYAQLMSELQPDRGRWSLTAPDEPPDVRFPPLLLLPALETLVRTDPASALAVSVRETQEVVTLEARTACRLEPHDAEDLERRLREGLRQGFAGASVALEDAPFRPAVLIRIPVVSNRPKAERTAAAPLVAIHMLEGEPHGS